MDQYIENILIVYFVKTTGEKEAFFIQMTSIRCTFCHLLLLLYTFFFQKNWYNGFSLLFVMFPPLFIEHGPCLMIPSHWYKRCLIGLVRWFYCSYFAFHHIICDVLLWNAYFTHVLFSITVLSKLYETIKSNILLPSLRKAI